MIEAGDESRHGAQSRAGSYDLAVHTSLGNQLLVRSLRVIQKPYHPKRCPRISFFPAFILITISFPGLHFPHSAFIFFIVRRVAHRVARRLGNDRRSMVFLVFVARGVACRASRCALRVAVRVALRIALKRKRRSMVFLVSVARRAENYRRSIVFPVSVARRASRTAHCAENYRRT